MITVTFPTIRGKTVDDIAPIDKLGPDMAIIWSANDFAVDDHFVKMLKNDIIARLIDFGWSLEMAKEWLGFIEYRAICVSAGLETADGPGLPTWGRA